MIAINHPGWLDTQMTLFLVEQILGRDYYMMATTSAVTEKPFMRKFGVFGVDENDAFAVGKALQYGARLLLDQANRCLVMFPQGDFVRSTERPIRIQLGAAQIARMVKHVSILPVALHYDIFLKTRPDVFVRIGEPINFRGDVPAARILTETIRQRMEQELDMLQMEAYDFKYDDYEVVLKQFVKYLLRGWGARITEVRQTFAISR
ncbi:MAG: hypothetical protein GY803_07475 [Chloroflexi bacterium]|nr:hypothetical protein [Chloroflexota bacterium]